MNINEFKKGDIITRTSPSLAIFGGGMDFFTGKIIESHGDRSYMGDELEFIGIANGQIYFRVRKCKYGFMEESQKIRCLELDAYSEGWDIYINPETLLLENQPVKQIDKKQLQIALQKALDLEDYEKAEEIQKQLNNL